MGIAFLAIEKSEIKIKTLKDGKKKKGGKKATGTCFLCFSSYVALGIGQGVSWFLAWADRSIEPSRQNRPDALRIGRTCFRPRDLTVDSRLNKKELHFYFVGSECIAAERGQERMGAYSPPTPYNIIIEGSLTTAGPFLLRQVGRGFWFVSPLRACQFVVAVSIRKGGKGESTSSEVVIIITTGSQQGLTATIFRS